MGLPIYSWVNWRGMEGSVLHKNTMHSLAWVLKSWSGDHRCNTLTAGPHAFTLLNIACCNSVGASRMLHWGCSLLPSPVNYEIQECFAWNVKLRALVIKYINYFVSEKWHEIPLTWFQGLSLSFAVWGIYSAFVVGMKMLTSQLLVHCISVDRLTLEFLKLMAGLLFK